MNKSRQLDIALIGGGIMSATLATILKRLKPSLKIEVYERLDSVAQESSNPWNNAGTGHAALCELNYMPDSKDGSLPSSAKAVEINEQFQLSRQFWSYLVENGVLGDPATFIKSVPHMTFVQGEKDVDYLKRRFQALKSEPLFAGMQFSEDPAKIKEWAPLLIEGRNQKTAIAATKIESGTDVDFGAITSQLFSHLQSTNVVVRTSTEVRNLERAGAGWQLRLKNTKTGQDDFVNANFVFVGAGGWALKLLQKSGVSEAKGYGTFPISGEFLRTANPELVNRHLAKVYSQAAVGAPPMSVPHLDTRFVDGQASLLFGPFAGANPKFLKNGSILDLPLSIRPANIVPYLAVALKNLGLIKYLIGELLKTRKGKIESLRSFVPEAKDEDWELITAGQRAQVIKKDRANGGVLQFGTEVITSADGSIAGLLGASPGASTAVHIMLQVLRKSFADDYVAWLPKLQAMIPSLGTRLSDDPASAAENMAMTAKTLKLRK